MKMYRTEEKTTLWASGHQNKPFICSNCMRLDCIWGEPTPDHFSLVFCGHDCGSATSERIYTQIHTRHFVFICSVKSAKQLCSASYIKITLTALFAHSTQHSVLIQIYLWLFSRPGTRSPEGSMGEGSRLRQEAKDWLESSLDTVTQTHTHTHTHTHTNTHEVIYKAILFITIFRF